ncbi:hypothetical protein WS83_24370 [Burkholderia sp. MSMB2042]|nr:hypothetical protein WS78_29820 [Burkholderia savannae]KVG44905.1 hypothetical protein WS77_06925 [Burkholderia sp. MSMB0265]KVG89892.1 hypothetical protein WS81_19160 [Burkholderia sp. MSMB2040]KVG96030.1 hypothetical protein WS82_02335 [Burkholderia sp. MSMB2041]KVG99657.1 hypothetical protein WS83_24370 [Burkholderia sp. MSMB2042]
MEVDPTQFTRKRVMATTRKMKSATVDESPWVALEAEDRSGLVIAAMGPDSPKSRADAARMMALWNAALDAEEPLSSSAG